MEYLLKISEYDKLLDIRAINDLELNDYSLYRDSLDKTIVLKAWPDKPNNYFSLTQFNWRIKPEFATQLQEPYNAKRDLIRVLYDIVSRRINNVRR